MIVYGKVDGASSEAGAMGIILHSLHGQYGDKPRVGNVFRVRGSNSVAVFFTLVKRTQGNTGVAGMLIASRAADGHFEAALLSDDAARFGTTINPMLKTLFDRWHPGSGSSTSSAASPHGAAAMTGGSKIASLRPYTASDQSASVALPDGFKVTTGVGGTIIAEGPNGENVVPPVTTQFWTSTTSSTERASGLMPPAASARQGAAAPTTAPAAADLRKSLRCELRIVAGSIR
jgi:hypothetical protein